MTETTRSVARKVGKGILWTGGGVLGAVALYLAASAALSAVPVAASGPVPNPQEEIEAYILSNGVHTDLVVPVRSVQMDWTQLVPYTDTPAADTTMQFIGFGWGDKGFYLDTPTWAELKPSTALKAMFWLSTTAMHTTFHHRPTVGADCVRLRLSPAEYARLIVFIKTSFDYDAQGRPRHIAGHGYGQHDAFYEAKRTYNLFYTCNTWANNGLKAAGQKAALWTPFDFGILWQYR
ncbi:TIGR02117 family protein [Hymenobacter metallilatus]|uniref:TIGR02117 family protein n=1 Tax=Hymenobacter metallilatus TaxID=2493666 RepID=A0A428JLC9_9BACT|nr:TIGR02117 family protein [Hymenobacter metallilatus]RSK33896.1 TIGR02117 family protein [Hymenobacter metallilatus]